MSSTLQGQMQSEANDPMKPHPPPVAPNPNPIYIITNIQPLPLQKKAPTMPTLIQTPSIIKAAGNKPKIIEEYTGNVNSGHTSVSVARMLAPEGWVEPGQRPDFEEITVVLSGVLRVDYEDGSMDVKAGQAVVAKPGEWLRYSCPEPGGAEYIAVCLPAFTPDAVHRDED